LRFFFSPSAGGLLFPAVFLAALVALDASDLAGALEAVEAGALPAVEAGFEYNVGQWSRQRR